MLPLVCLKLLLNQTWQLHISNTQEKYDLHCPQFKGEKANQSYEVDFQHVSCENQLQLNKSQQRVK